MSEWLVAFRDKMTARIIMFLRRASKWSRTLFPRATESEDSHLYLAYTIKERRLPKMIDRRDSDSKPVIRQRRIPIIIAGRRISVSAFLIIFVFGLILTAWIIKLSNE